MTPASRTVTLPTNPGASWDDFAWDPKYAADSLDYVLDCSDWLNDAGRVIVSSTASLTSGLVPLGSSFGLTGNAKTSVVLELTGGVPLTVEQVAFEITLDSGRVVSALVALPIRSSFPSGLVPYLPPDEGLTVGGVRITIGGAGITI